MVTFPFTLSAMFIDVPQQLWIWQCPHKSMIQCWLSLQSSLGFFFEHQNSSGITWGSCCHRNPLRCEAPMTTASQCCDGNSLRLNLNERQYLWVFCLQFKIPIILCHLLLNRWWFLSLSWYLCNLICYFRGGCGKRNKYPGSKCLYNCLKKKYSP